jgi:hypothetical protein
MTDSLFVHSDLFSHLLLRLKVHFRIFWRLNWIQSEIGKAVTAAISDQEVKLHALGAQFPPLRRKEMNAYLFRNGYRKNTNTIHRRRRHFLPGGRRGGSSENVLEKIRVSSWSLILQNALHPWQTPKLLFIINKISNSMKQSHTLRS